MSSNTTINKQNKFTLKKSLIKLIKTQPTFEMKQLILLTGVMLKSVSCHIFLYSLTVQNLPAYHYE